MNEATVGAWAFLLGLYVDSLFHRRVCPCRVCREWREEVRRDALAELRSVEEPAQNHQGTEGGEK